MNSISLPQSGMAHSTRLCAGASPLLSHVKPTAQFEQTVPQIVTVVSLTITI